jgi:hypothetical protein
MFNYLQSAQAFNATAIDFEIQGQKKGAGYDFQLINEKTIRISIKKSSKCKKQM